MHLLLQELWPSFGTCQGWWRRSEVQVHLARILVRGRKTSFIFFLGFLLRLSLSMKFLFPVFQIEYLYICFSLFIDMKPSVVCGEILFYLNGLKRIFFYLEIMWLFVWFRSDTHVQPGDIVNILVDRGQSVANERNVMIVNNSSGQIVVNPDLLLSGTTIVSGVHCLRR